MSRPSHLGFVLKRQRAGFRALDRTLHTLRRYGHRTVLRRRRRFGNALFPAVGRGGCRAVPNVHNRHAGISPLFLSD